MKHASNLLLLAALALSFTGCNDPLNVQDPDIVPPGNLNDKTVLPTIRAGAIGDFALAYTGSGADGSGGTVEGVTMYGGLLGDELINSETFPTRIEVDARGPIQKTNADVGLWFRNMQRARGPPSSPPSATGRCHQIRPRRQDSRRSSRWQGTPTSSWLRPGALVYR